MCVLVYCANVNNQHKSRWLTNRPPRCAGPVGDAQTKLKFQNLIIHETIFTFTTCGMMGWRRMVGEGNKKYDFQLIKLYVGKGLKLWPISHCLKMLFQIFSWKETCHRSVSWLSHDRCRFLVGSWGLVGPENFNYEGFPKYEKEQEILG